MQYYKCKNCDIVVYQSNNGNIKISATNKCFREYVNLDLTCNEILIKNILE